jgi:zinc protease
MAGCLYDPDDCEAERTIIISELQGAENDPDQLLDQEVTAAAFTSHPYRHPTIGWLADLQSMTRDDLYQYYRRYYVPNNATLVVVGDVDADDVLRRIARYFGSITAGEVPGRLESVEPQQTGERRVVVQRPGASAYLKVAYRAPAATDAAFFPALVLDAILTGAKGVNLWSSFRVPPPQRQARLYRALVDAGFASSVFGAMLPTEQPFLYTLSVSACDGTPLSAVEEALTDEVDRVRRAGVTPKELARAKAQLGACLVFDRDSITNIAHQLGYFATIDAADELAQIDKRLGAVDVPAVNAAAEVLLEPKSRTVGWFDPQPL